MEALLKPLSTSEPALRQHAVSAGKASWLTVASLVPNRACRAALRYLGNIARQPEEMKFQRVRASNKYFASNVGVLGGEAAKSFMGWCGFEERVEQDGQFFVFKPSPLQAGPQSPQQLAAGAHKRIHFLKNVGTQ
jgi:hypothetical protein